MRFYHLYFYILKFTVLLLLILISLKIIPINGKFFTLIDFIFKVSIGLFIVIFFSKNTSLNINKYDRLIIIMAGFILLLLIDYVDVINILFNTNYRSFRKKVLCNDKEEES